jgi:hypothetical protein
MNEIINDEPGKAPRTRGHHGGPAPNHRVDELAGEDSVATPRTRCEVVALARWRELIDPDQAWWTRPEGVGLRLRLEELLGLSAARQAVTVPQRPLETLLPDALKMFNDPKSYCGRRYPEIRLLIVKWFPKKADPSRFMPGGSAHAVVEAALEHLRRKDVVADVLDELARLTSSPGENLEQLAEVEWLIELLDAELQYEGYSQPWRAEAVTAVSEAFHATPTRFADVVRETLEVRRLGGRKYDVFIPLARLVRSSDDGTGGVGVLTAEEMQNNVIASWQNEEVAQVDLGHGVIRYSDIGAADPWSAAIMADDRFQLDSSLWRLRGYDFERRDQVIVHDASDHGFTGVVTLPVETVALLPEGFDAYQPRIGTGSTKIDDAFAQLSQARTASSATALADIWTSSEILFSGNLDDPNYAIADVLASMARFLFVREFLAYLGDRAKRAGYAPRAHGVGAAWLLDDLAGEAGDEDPGHEQVATNPGDGLDKAEAGNNREDLLAVLASSDDSLAWLRLRRLLSFDDGGFVALINSVGLTTGRVAARAYLVRNSVVHAGNRQRNAALAGTLPAFAGIVRACLAWVQRTQYQERPLVAAAESQISVSQLLEELDETRAGALAALRPFASPPERPPVLEVMRPRKTPR